MPPKNKAPSAQLSLFEVEEYLKTAPCVPLLRQKVAEWREAGYSGATEVTQRLLNWWFASDHRLPDGRPFVYHRAQRDAIETLIYVYEVAHIRSRRALYEQFARSDEPIRLSAEDKDHFARFATKMATGSGKTKVMSLAIVWQYFNVIMGGGDDYARTFLIVASSRPTSSCWSGLPKTSRADVSSSTTPSCRRVCASSGMSKPSCAAIPNVPTPMD